MDDDLDVVLPRGHHYEFAHRVLPSWLFQDAAAVLAGLSQDPSSEALREAWEQFGEGFPAEDRVAPRGLRHEIRVIDDLVVILFVLPVPVRTTEAYFVAGVLWRPDPMRGTDVRVFTLEHHDPADYASAEELDALRRDGRDRPCAMLCEWTREWAHANLGVLPSNDVDSFCTAVIDALRPPFNDGNEENQPGER